jgi:phage host-nuclease inhibitor protein Gam
MAITKELIEDKIEIVGEFKNVQVRTATVIKEDGVEINRSFHRHVLNCLDDISEQSAEVQAICNAVWTDELKAACQEHLDSQTV